MALRKQPKIHCEWCGKYESKFERFGFLTDCIINTKRTSFIDKLIDIFNNNDYLYKGPLVCDTCFELISNNNEVNALAFRTNDKVIYFNNNEIEDNVSSILVCLIMKKGKSKILLNDDESYEDEVLLMKKCMNKDCLICVDC